ncbi:arylformamidase [Desulfohalotomaculum tongense]|uniref:cyclase family protein n=1 Tax=Desulforadius tongensis TaxID=1216062 RepID=UPI00195612B8|nr:cyclase family protein [Desulforadius tongensis]MBM7855548.1 arylformamidase [Desulforadius tongensis]
MSKIYDITRSINNGMVVYPGDIPVQVKELSAVKNGDLANSTAITMSSHTGTHVDAPKHLYSDGRALDQIPLETLVGPAAVIELPNTGAITKKDLSGFHLQGVKRLLFKTANSGLWTKKKFVSDYAHLTPGAAEYLVQSGCRLVGIDYLSVDPPGEVLPVHEILLSAGVVIIEGLNLSAVPPGRYELICLPLKIAGGDGAPARVILRELQKDLG